MQNLNNIHARIANLDRRYKRLLMVLADLVALPLALWSGFALRFSDWWPQKAMAPFWWLFIITPVVGVVVFARLGLYRAVVRFMGSQALLAVFKGALLLALMMLAGVYFYGRTGFPRSVPIIFALVSLIYVGGTRVMVRSYYRWLFRHYAEKEPVLIYGAGTHGAQLAAALSKGREFLPAVFIDDDRNLWGSIVQGVRVFPPSQVRQLLETHKIGRVLLAMPRATRAERKRALDLFDQKAVRVQTVPSLPEIVSGAASVDQLREVELEDLLGRDPVPPKQELLTASVRDKVVMVTGAGGSIGSEMCRQIAALRPKSLILFELSEFSLYAIDHELREWQREQGVDFPVYALLGSVCDESRVEAIIRGYRVQSIYHAAAYKHVPLVEHNIFEGVRNNIFGTRTVAEAANRFGAERFILISTDKAVRPTNVMGATKRFAELILQDLATRSERTVFSMVRFGNVLDSSGSVVPLFRRQIAAGGPITVTHREIIRYFMTIPEASSLVIQAGSMARGGDLFVLDMGDMVPILSLARRMVQLSGLSVKDDQNPGGDIEIVFTGLRPGEKLYEELLIGDNVTGTQHPKIMRAHEDGLPCHQIDGCLAKLRQAEKSGDCKLARAILQEAVTGFKPSCAVVDYLARCQENTTRLELVDGGKARSADGRCPLPS